MLQMQRLHGRSLKHLAVTTKLVNNSLSYNMPDFNLGIV